MKHYCSVLDLLTPFIGSPAEGLSKLTSEEVLNAHLSMPIQRVDLEYKLVLSQAKVISISGDSGSGKTTISSLIKPLFFFDNLLEFETDRYHKWERQDYHWKTISHLNPEANFLEKMQEDTFNLKLGNAIVSVDYDHSTGKFTAPKPVDPATNIILCGLHTMYSSNLRELSDLKIFIDTDECIKTRWKLERDVHERGRKLEDVIKQIESRRYDYETYILPQREFSDIIIRQCEDKLVIFIRNTKFSDELLTINCKLEKTDVWLILTFSDPNVCVESEVRRFTETQRLPQFNPKSGYFGVIQLVILTTLYK
jgi:uridine kinase